MTTTTWRMIGGTRNLARPTRIWQAPPETYSRGIDWIAVERYLDNDLPASALTPLELREVAAVMHHDGVPIRTMARQLGIHEYAAKELLAAAGLLEPHQTCTVEGCWHARSGHGLCKRHLHHEAGLVRQAHRTRARALEAVPA